jgi:Chlamydia polymorphic membrane protein (Chlamydia_PMP) repeat
MNNHRNTLSTVIAVTALCVPPRAAPPTTIHVPSDYCTIQEAIGAAPPGAEIVVAPGTYNEAIDFIGKAIHLRSSAGPQVTAVDATGLGTSVVTCATGEGLGTILEGFTITGGVGTVGPFGLRYGGGMRIDGASPTVSNVVFRSNSATLGGGMSIQAGSPVVTTCVFEQNTASTAGGLSNAGIATSVIGCLFEANVASGDAGGMRNGSSGVPNDNSQVLNCVFKANSAAAGGGMVNKGTTTLVESCTFENNSASQWGGGLGSAASNSTVLSCAFKGNSAGISGGGISMFGYSTPEPDVSDTLFCMNVPDHLDGAWNDSGGNEFLDQCPQEPTDFCNALDGSLASCPCANPGDPNTGCDSPIPPAQGGGTTGGIRLDLVSQQTTPTNRAVFTGSGYPFASTPSVVVLRGTALDSASPVVFGDGLRCVSTPVVRLGRSLAAGGVSTHTISHGAMAGSGVFFYQLLYRSQPASFCDPAANFNLSNGRTLVW